MAIGFNRERLNALLFGEEVETMTAPITLEVIALLPTTHFH